MVQTGTEVRSTYLLVLLPLPADEGGWNPVREEASVRALPLIARNT